MTDQSTTVDEAGIARTTTGEINNPVAPQGTTGQPPDPKATTTPTTTEAKTVLNEEPKPPAEPPKEGEQKEPPPKEAAKGPPEKYADFKVPEGFVMTDETKGQVNTLFKELGLTQEQGQKLVDLNSALQKSAADAGAKAFADTSAKWLKDSQEHPDLKGKLGPGEEVNVRIGRLLGQVDPKLASDFRALMDLTGAGNHQAFIRMMDYAARKLTEPSFVAGNGPATAGQSRGPQPQPTAAQAMWPNLANRNTQ